MLDEKLPDDVKNLRPRKLRLSKDAERLLAGVTEAEADPKRQQRASGLRPNADSVNAARCVGCGQIEYITREYCRCGHYLAGQIEDEYLAWEQNLAETHERLVEEAEQRMKPVRWAASISFPFLLWPPLQLLLYGEGMPFSTWLWIIPGAAILGLFAVAEKLISAKRDASALEVQTASFEGFLNERLQMGNGASFQMGAE
ncbi:hypothetical protein [Pseudaestuariivita atlantica]|uniref:Uncharacterized protein n=1 Tax=Pseudaestuariivita atlantica TaxID=1317121 RepID=A0A0L1JNU7_9RHOB|nr:hypothetical protein [Pseudaestuariivita atlantica]KNG93402.1 hypothetical protein ATO11_13320 [Pseudaestuariivita atlantica]